MLFYIQRKIFNLSFENCYPCCIINLTYYYLISANISCKNVGTMIQIQQGDSINMLLDVRDDDCETKMIRHFYTSER